MFYLLVTYLLFSTKFGKTVNHNSQALSFGTMDVLLRCKKSTLNFELNKMSFIANII